MTFNSQLDPYKYGTLPVTNHSMRGVARHQLASGIVLCADSWIPTAFTETLSKMFSLIALHVILTQFALSRSSEAIGSLYRACLLERATILYAISMRSLSIGSYTRGIIQADTDLGH